MPKSVYFQIEANFGKGWQRNGQKHDSLEMATAMSKHFKNIADVRIIKTTETIQEEVINPEGCSTGYLPENKWMRDILEQSKKTWKPEFLEALMVEECCELGVELSRGIGRPSRKDKAKIQEELADVLITAWELAQHYDDDGGVSAWVRKKLQREKERMDDSEYGKDEKLIPNQGNSMLHWTEKSVDSFLYRIIADFLLQLEDKIQSEGLSKAQLAERLQLSEKQVSQLLNNPDRITLKTAVELARAVGLKISVVAYDDGDPENRQGPVNAEIFRLCWVKAGKPSDFFC